MPRTTPRWLVDPLDPATAERIRLRILRVVDVPHADEVRWRHHAETVVLHVADDALQRVGEVREWDRLRRALLVKPLKDALAKRQQRNWPPRLGDDAETDLREQIEHLAVLLGGQTPRPHGRRLATEQADDAAHGYGV